MIDVNHPTLSISRQCQLINLSRASYYRSVDTDIGIETPENLELMRLIDEEYTRHPFYGSRQMRNYFRRQGRLIGRKRVQRLMRLMGLVSVAPKPNTSKRNKEHKIYPYLLRVLLLTDLTRFGALILRISPCKVVLFTSLQSWIGIVVRSWLGKCQTLWRIHSALAP